MPAIFSKNCIFAGELDSYCLVCTQHLRDEEDILKHIQEPVHKNNVDTCVYFEKFKEDCIRKVKLGYFCEFCNLTFPTVSKLGLHVEERSHLDRKRRGWLKREGDTVVFLQHNVQITENSWNGIVDNACLLCNVEFDDAHVHNQEQNHILNLIRSKVNIEPNSILRKIDGVFQCLTCDCVVAEDVLKEHMTSNDHTNKYTEKKTTKKTNLDNETKSLESELIIIRTDKKKTVDLDELYSKTLSAENYVFNHDPDGRLTCMLCDWILEGDVKQHVENKHHQALLKLHKERSENKKCDAENAHTNGYDNGITKTDTKSEVLNFVSTNYMKDINIDLIKDIIVCKKCSKHLLFDIEVIKKHMGEHDVKVSSKRFSLIPEQQSDKVDGKTLYTKPVLKSKEKPAISSLKEMEDLAKKNGMLLNKDENKIYCNICSSQVTATLTNLKEHLEGSKHKKNLPKLPIEKKNSKKNVQKVVLKDFIYQMAAAETETGLFFIINDEILVERVHFAGGLTMINNKIICKICYIDLVQENFQIHLKTSAHHEKVMNSKVITSVGDEFVRQISSDLFDCVHCGKMENDWDDMLIHLSTSEHIRRKELHKKMLTDIKVEEIVFKKRLEFMILQNLLGMRSFPPF